MYCGGPSLWGQVSREAVALVKPVTSPQRPSVGPAPGEGQEGGRGRRAGVSMQELVSMSTGESWSA